MTILDVQQISKQFRDHSNPVVNSLSLKLEESELLGLLGPSGCGKTTLLRLIAGFEQPSMGKILIAGESVAGEGHWIPPEGRNAGMVFQDYALFPHLTVIENIAFGLKHRSLHLSAEQTHQRVTEVLSLVGLLDLGKRYPHQLSGGQQQRVALARALAPRPSLILMDEPLSNLDVQVRQRLRHEVRRILKAAGTAAIFVTHDQEEALAISDRVAVMRQGTLEQIGTPETIYINPATRFVAEFVTQANFLTAEPMQNLWKTEIGAWAFDDLPLSDDQQKREIIVRQEDIALEPDENASVIICDRQFLGREYRYCLETASGKQLHARTGLSQQLAVGTKVKLSIPDQAVHLF